MLLVALVACSKGNAPRGAGSAEPPKTAVVPFVVKVDRSYRITWYAAAAPCAGT